MSRNFKFGLLLIAGVAVSSSGTLRLAAQRPGAPQQGAAPAAPQAGAPLPGAMIDFLGTTDRDIPLTAPMDRGTPKVRTTDTYYYDRAVDEMPPDEFISNPDSEFDWQTLKAWHVPPLLKTVKIIGPRRVKPGDTITFEAEVADPTGTTTGATLSFYGPQGRRTTLTANFRTINPGSPILRGTLTIRRNQEPGVYRHIRFGITNEVRSAKAYFSDYHPAMRGQPLEIEVLPSPDADVIPATIDWVKIGSLDASDAVVHRQKIDDPIAIYAKATDNKSGVNRVYLRINKLNSNRFQEIDLKPMIGQKDVYVTFLSLPKWWESGEYTITTITAEDKAGMEQRYFYSTSSLLKNAKVLIDNAPANVDSKPPQLVSIWLDAATGTMGQPVKVNAILVDDKSGVGTVSAIFQAVPSYQNNVRVILRKVPMSDVVMKPGLNANGNLYQGDVVTSVWQEPGKWQLMRMVARDNADNYMDLLPSDHPEFAEVALEFGGGQRLRERMLNELKGQRGSVTSAQPVAAAPAPPPAPAASGAQKIRRVDMVAPHPPRGACLNCHEP